MDNLPVYLSHARSGALRALAVSSPERWFAAPDVPSIAEQGYPDFEVSHWWYIAAPAGMRLELVKKLSDTIVKGLKSDPRPADPGVRCRRARREHGGTRAAHRRRKDQVEEGDRGGEVEAAVTAAGQRAGRRHPAGTVVFDQAMTSPVPPVSARAGDALFHRARRVQMTPPWTRRALGKQEVGRLQHAWVDSPASVTLSVVSNATTVSVPVPVIVMSPRSSNP